MRTRGVVLQGMLAAVGLAAALAVWRREPPETPGEVTVLEAPTEVLARVRYEDAAGWVELFREGDGVALRLGTKGPGVPQTPKELRGNAQAERLFTRFLPLRATRSLGVLDATALREVGLAESTRALTVVWARQPHVLPLAASASGWGGPYARRAPEGTVFLLSPSLLPDLENGGWRLVDRALHRFEPGEYDSLTLSAGEVSRVFQVRARGRGGAELFPSETPDAPDERARAWHERVWRLSPGHADFLGRGVLPAGGSPREVVRVEYRRAGVELGWLSLARGAGGELYAGTEYTVGWARLPPWADALVLEAEQLLQRPSPRHAP